MYSLCRNPEQLLLKENVLHIVLLYVEDCVAASRNISMFFKERAAAFENILTTASQRKNVQLLIRIMPTFDFEVKNRLK